MEAERAVIADVSGNDFMAREVLWNLMKKNYVPLHNHANCSFNDTWSSHTAVFLQKEKNISYLSSWQD